MHHLDQLRSPRCEFDTVTPLASTRILCVDSDSESSSYYFEPLRNAGCEVFTCFHGRLANRAAAAFRPEICVINLSLPDLPGHVIARQVRSRVEKSPLYLIAIIPDPERLELISKQLNAFHAFLIAPFKPQDLLQLVDSWFLRRARFQFERAVRARSCQPIRNRSPSMACA